MPEHVHVGMHDGCCVAGVGCVDFKCWTSNSSARATSPTAGFLNTSMMVFQVYGLGPCRSHVVNTCSNESRHACGFPAISSLMLSRVPLGSSNWMPTDLHLAGILEAISFIRSFRLHIKMEAEEPPPVSIRNQAEDHKLVQPFMTILFKYCNSLSFRDGSKGV